MLVSQKNLRNGMGKRANIKLLILRDSQCNLEEFISGVKAITGTRNQVWVRSHASFPEENSSHMFFVIVISSVFFFF